MSIYIALKWLHILSATILFGTGIGIAFFKWITDRSGSIKAIRVINERAVLADWIFTTPAVILQPVTGFALVYVVGYPLFSAWIIWTLILYFIAGACWLPVLWLQIVMRDISRKADDQNVPLPSHYWKLARIWFWLGVPAFGALLIVYWLMLVKPV